LTSPGSIASFPQFGYSGAGAEGCSTRELSDKDVLRYERGVAVR
jgi:hypothetical protein